MDSSKIQSDYARDNQSEYTIKLSGAMADAVILLDNRYFFGVFKDVSMSEDDEYLFRDTLNTLARHIKEGI